MYNVLQVKYLSPAFANEEQVRKDSYEFLAKTMRLKMIAITPIQKRDFLEFYKKGTQKGYVGRMA